MRGCGRTCESQWGLGFRWRCGGVFCFLLKAQLAASGFDVVTFLTPQGGGDGLAAKDICKGVLLGFRGSRPRESFHGIIGNQIHLGPEVAGDAGEMGRLFQRVVDVFDQDILEGNDLAFGGAIRLEGWDQGVERVFAIDGHDSFPHGIGGAVQ